MKIEELDKLKGAARFGSCNECHAGASDGAKMYRIGTNDNSLCLCEKHLKTLKAKIFYILDRGCDE